jgi:hypothetical protein
MRPGPGRGGGVLESLGASWLPWLVARALVLGALELARYLGSHIRPAPAVLIRIHEGLLGWDAGYYRDIAMRGYAGVPRSALRFFPLLSIVTRGLHAVSGLSDGACLIGLVNLLALVAAVLLHRLVVAETGRADLARRSVWILALAPSAFVLVMGYSEALLLVLVVAAFLALRSGHWWWAAVAGYLAGLSRPIGVVLVLPALVEAVRRGGSGRSRASGWGRSTPRGLPSVVALGRGAGRLLAVVAPAAGTATYLGWVAARYGDFWLPFRIEVQPGRHGHFADPLVTVAHDARALFHGHIGTGLHVPWLIVFLALLVASFLRWPASYGLYALGVLVLAVSSTNFDSLERYALSAFPLTLAAAGMVEGEAVERTVFPLLGGLLVSYALLAFTNSLVP